MDKKRYKDKRRISKIYLIIILNITIFMSVLGYKVFAGKASSIVMSANLKENYMSALSYDGSETDNSKERAIQTDKDYIYLSDMQYNSQSKTGWGNIQKNKNSDGNTIRLRKDGEVVSYPIGMGFHADGQLIYDISEYSTEFTRFIADVGVDASRPDVASIKVTISVSDDEKTWEEREVKGLKEILKSANDCVSVDVDIEGKKFLKIYVDKADNVNSSDHCVLGAAKIAKADYDKNSEVYDKIKKIKEYDKEITSGDCENIYSTNKADVLKREFVNRFGYWNLQNLANTDENCRKAMDWILSNDDVLELVIDVGEINDGYKFLNSLGALYNAEYEKLKDDSQLDLYKKMMIAVSAAYSSERISSPFSFSHLAPNYDVISHFEKVKEMYLEGDFSKEFKTLKIELMRMVMQDAVRDDEAEWFNWWTRGGKTGKEEAGTFDKGAFWLSYITPVYDREENFNIQNYSRFDEKYKLKKYNVPFADEEGKIYRYWMTFEDGGICWNCSRVGQSTYRINGLPSTGVYQPSHEAFVGYSENDEGIGYWDMGNNIFGWGRSCTQWGGGNGYRLLLNWGNKPFCEKNVSGSNAGNNIGYIILAQANINDYDKFIKSSHYNLIANSYSDDSEKVKVYKKALEVNELNLDSYDYLIQTYNKMGDEISEEEWLSLANEIIDAYTYYPNAMDDLLKLIKPHLEEDAKLLEVEMKEREALVKATSLTSKEQNIQFGEVKSLASVILGNTNTNIASFSFDGEDAGNIVVSDDYNINWKYSLDGGKTWENSETNAKKVKIPDKKIAEVNDENDIEIEIDGTKTHYVIDILKGTIPRAEADISVLYANDDENRILGADDTMEWRITKEKILKKDESEYPEFQENSFPDAEWTSFSKEAPDLTQYKTIEVRAKSSKNYIASDPETLNFTDSQLMENACGMYGKTYIPVSHMKIIDCSSQAVEHAGSADNLIDGNYRTRYHSAWDNTDSERWVIIGLDREFTVCELRYYRSGTGNGMMRAGTFYGCTEDEFNADNPNDSEWTELCKKTYCEYHSEQGKDEDYTAFEVEPENNKPIKYIKLQADQAQNGNWFSGKMIKLYRDFTDDHTASGAIEYDVTKPTQENVTASLVNIFPGNAKITNVVPEDETKVEISEDKSKVIFNDNTRCTFNFECEYYDMDTFKNEKCEGTATAIVENIDREVTEPKIEYSTKKLTNQSVHVTVKPTEDILIINNGKFIINEEGKIVNEITKKVVEDFRRDKKGNVIDPSIPVEENKETDKNILERYESNENQPSDFEYDFSTNGSYTIEYVDRAGNEGHVTINIDNIDNEAPNGLVTYSTTSPTDEEVTATISFPITSEDGEEIKEEEGVIITNENEENNQAVKYKAGSKKVTFTENGTFKFVYKDEAGNIGETVAEVNWIEQILESDDYEVKDKKIKKVEPETTLKTFNEKLTSKYTKNVFDKDGEVIEEDDTIIKTGDKVTANGSEYTVIVNGDVDGDGHCTEVDLNMLCDDYFDKEELTGIYLEAGDCDGNKKITLQDVAKMYSYIKKDEVKSIRLKSRTIGADASSDNEITALISTTGLNKEINAIGGELSYENLELKEIKSENSYWEIKTDGDKFIALRKEKSNADEEVIKVIFEIMESAGKKEISASLNNVRISDGEFEEDGDNKVKIQLSEISSEVPVTKVTIKSSSEKLQEKVATLEVGEEISLHAELEPSYTTETNVKWEAIGNDNNYIDINSEGKITAKKITDETGVKVRATVGEESDEITVKVVKTDVTEIKDDFNGNDIYLVEPEEGSAGNHSMKIEVTVLPENATNKEVKWESSDMTVATVVDGTITAVSNNKPDDGERTCRVTVKSVDNESVSKMYNVHVVDTVKKVENVEIVLPEENKEGKVELGKGLELTVNITPADATIKETKWEVDDSKILEVSDAGYITTKKEGTATVTVTVKCQEEDCEGHTAEIEIEVLPKSKIEVEKVEIVGEDNITIKELEEKQLHAIVTPDDATDKTVIWESSDSSIVSVTSGGKILGVKEGTAIITVKAGDKSASITVNVEPMMRTDLTVYVINEKENFVSGMTFRLDKKLNANSDYEINIYEGTENGKIDFKNLEDGLYILRAYKKVNSKLKSENTPVVEYEFEIKNGKVLFKEDGKEIQAENLVVIIPEDDESKAKVVNGANYPTIEEEYQKYINGTSENPGEDTPSGGDKPSGGSTSNSGDKTNGGSTSNKGDSSSEGDKTSVGDTSNKGDTLSGGDKTNGSNTSSDNNSSGSQNDETEVSSDELPKTSDINLNMFVAMMIVSFIGIVCIIYDKTKNRKHKK